MRQILSIATLCILSFSCSKVSLEAWPVMKNVARSTIPTTGNITSLSFPSSQMGFAVTSEGELFRTQDGGASWSILNLPTTSMVWEVRFASETVGYCRTSNSLFRTQDSGGSWTSAGPCDYFALDENGHLIVGIEDFILKDEIFLSEDDGQTFTFVADYYVDGLVIYAQFFDGIFACGSDEEIVGVNVSTAESVYFGAESFGGYRVAADFFANDSRRVLVGTEGMIQYDDGSTSGLHEVHINNLEYSAVHGHSDICVAVGPGGIVSNIDLGNEYKWKEVLDEELVAFPGPYYSVCFISSTRVVIGGESGEILIGEI